MDWYINNKYVFTYNGKVQFFFIVYSSEITSGESISISCTVMLIEYIISIKQNKNSNETTKLALHWMLLHISFVHVL